MKILHCLDHYMPRHMAGTELYVHRLATIQQQSGYEVAILIPHFEYYHPGEFEAQYAYDGIEVFQYQEPANPKEKNKRPDKLNTAGIKEFSDRLQALKPDIIHFHELTRSIGLRTEHVKMAKMTGAVVILTMHLSGYTCNTNTLINHGRLCKGEILGFACSVCSCKTLFHLPALVAYPVTIVGLVLESAGITRKLPRGKMTTLLAVPAMINRIKEELADLVNSVDKIVCLADWYKAILVQNRVAENKITVIRQGLAIGAEPSFKKKQSPAALPLRIIFLGRIQPQKGLHLLIEALKTFRSDEILLDIYGQPENTAYYRECIQAVVVQTNVHFKGAIAKENVVAVMSSYDLLCLPSTFSEMSPLVILEAFAAGIPVLASNVYGNAAQIQHGVSGWLVTFKSSEALQKQVAMLVENPGLIEEAKKNLPSGHSFNEVARAYDHLYRSRE